MNLKEFERQVLAGEITDFEPYFKEQYNSRKTDQYDQMDRRYILAKNGIETDRVATMDGYNTIMDIIKAMLEDIKLEITREEPELNLAHGHLIGKQGGKIAALFREYLSDINRQELSSK